MQIEYRRTFTQFIDNYLATYYGGGVQTLKRLLGGPAIIVAGSYAVILAATPTMWPFFRVTLNLLGWLLIFYGTVYTLRPAFNLFLVWLRRAEFIGEDGTIIRFELLPESLSVHEGDSQFEVPLDRILAVQRRANSAWILTKPDNILYIPSEDLLSGDFEAFIEALDAAIAPDPEDD